MNEEQIRRVWEGLITAEIEANYFAELSNFYHRIQRITTWSTLCLSSGTLVSLLAVLPNAWRWVPTLLAVVTTALSAYNIAASNQKRATDAADLYAKWDKLAGEFQAIWEAVWADDALSRLQKCEETVRELSRAGTPFPNKEKKMQKWQTYVEERRIKAIA